MHAGKRTRLHEKKKVESCVTRKMFGCLAFVEAGSVNNRKRIENGIRPNIGVVCYFKVAFVETVGETRTTI